MFSSHDRLDMHAILRGPTITITRFCNATWSAERSNVRTETLNPVPQLFLLELQVWINRASLRCREKHTEFARGFKYSYFSCSGIGVHTSICCLRFGLDSRIPAAFWSFTAMAQAHNLQIASVFLAHCVWSQLAVSCILFLCGQEKKVPTYMIIPTYDLRKPQI